MELLKGKEVTEVIREEADALLGKLGGFIPTLAIVRVGEAPDQLSYERGAMKRMDSFGLKVRSCVFPEDISEEEFLTEFGKISDDPEVNGILLLKPLPERIDTKKADLRIDPAKDLDGISPVNIAKVFAGDRSGFAPCTAEAVIETLKAYEIPVRGRKAVVVGRSMVVGRPLAMLLVGENATVTICHTKTEDLPAECRQADILVACAGRAGLIGGDCVSYGAVVLDVGINVNSEGKLCGDVDAEDVGDIPSALTPVPGGVGAVTTAVLAKHLLQAALRQRGIA